MTVTEFINSLPEDMFADSHPDYCTQCQSWQCEHNTHEIHPLL